MHHIAVFILLTGCVLAKDQPLYSFSPAVGSGGGSTYSITGEGRITAVRVWELSRNYIYGFQFCYGFMWTPVVGFISGEPHEFELHDDEAIIQISGKYSHYIQSLVFTTNKGRSLHVGNPSGNSFNMYPENRDAELHIISGRVHGGISSIEAHWLVLRNDSRAKH
ncbi:zymogen granule membrane protein 16-like isoform 1-T2 [Menidia menidia]